MKYYVVVELIQEESSLETEVMRRKVYPCMGYKDAKGMFRLINRLPPES